MSIYLQVPNKNQLTLDKARRMLELIQLKVASREINNPDEFVAKTFESFKKLFSELDKPVGASIELREQDLRSAEEFADFLRGIEADLAVLFSGARALTEAAKETFNFNVALKSIIQQQLAKTVSISSDVKLLDSIPGTDVMVAGDDFSDGSRIDAEAIQGYPCDRLPGGMGMGLKRSGSASAVNLEKVNIEVTAKPSKITTRKKKWDRALEKAARPRTYEGKFYAPLGEAEPEGDKFHWSYEGTEEDAKSQQNSDDPAQSMPKLGTPIYDEGAAEDDAALIASRKNMLDGNPDSYWQVELTARPQSLVRWQEEMEARQNVEGNPPLEPVRMSDLEKKVLEHDFTDLTASIVIDLVNPVPVNWISLLPLNFKEGAWLEILKVETADEEDNWESLPNLEAHLNERVLTPEANEDLSEAEVAGVLSSTKSFAGQGLWVFPERVVRKVRIVVRQPIPIPNPYSVMRLTLERDVSTTTTVKTRKKKWGRVRDKTRAATDVDHQTYELELDYPRSVIAYAGENDSGSLVANKAGGEAAEAFGKVRERGAPGALAAIAILPIPALVAGLAPRTSKHYNVAVEATKWDLTGSSEVPKYDLVRYAIGIRDITISRYTFFETSNFVSVPFDFPNPITKVALEVLERIPEELRSLEEGPWVEYYVSFGTSAEWHRINPLSQSPFQNLDGEDIPMIINVNSTLAEEERNPVEAYVFFNETVTSARIKAVMKRPAGDENQTMSPVLVSYRLKATVEGEL